MNSADLEVIIARMKDRDSEIQHSALQTLHKEVKAYQGTVGIRNQEILETLSRMEECLEFFEGKDKRHLYDLLSVMNVLENDQLVLRYRIQGNTTDLNEWGHHYVRKLVSCIVDTMNGKLEREECSVLIEPIIRFLFSHNSEVEAIDFLMEVSGLPVLYSSEEAPEDSREQLESKERLWNLLEELVDDYNRNRVMAYMEEMAMFYDIEDLMLRLNKFDVSRYLVCLIKYNRKKQAVEFVKSLENGNYKKQCLYILARNSLYYKGSDEEEEILTNSHVTDIFFEVALSLEVLQPKKLEYMFKGLNKERIDAAAIANSLVHFAYCRDPVFMPQEGDFTIKQEYLDQLKLNKSISTLASVGVISAYDSSKVYEFYSEDLFRSNDVGSILALALSAYKSHDSDSSILNLLSSFLIADGSSSGRKTSVAAMVGINALYAASSSPSVYDSIFQLFSSPDSVIRLFAIYVLGSVYPGDAEILSSCIDFYSELPKDTPFANFAILGLGLFFYKIPYAYSGITQNNSLHEKAQIMHELFLKLDKYSKIMALGFMYVGSGNPAVIDDILSEAFTGETDALLESLGMIACCLIGVSDSLAVNLLQRISSSSLLLDSPHLRAVMPLSLAVLYASNPNPEIIDILEKSINSGDSTINSLVALGIVGAGSCSSRILRILDTNFAYVYKDSKASSALLFAQGLVNLGKGLFGLSPVCYDRQIIIQKNLIGLISSIFLFLDPSLFKEYPFMLYLIVNAISPKYIAGYNGTIKIGKPADIVGLAGNPNKISGAVIHSLPVVLNSNERALVEDEVCTAYIEDILVKK